MTQPGRGGVQQGKGQSWCQARPPVWPRDCHRLSAWGHMRQSSSPEGQGCCSWEGTL